MTALRLIPDKKAPIPELPLLAGVQPNHTE